MDLMHLLANGEAPPTRSLPMQVARSLGIRIAAGELEAGSLLPDENALCVRLGVSRTVVREAMKLLAAKGLIEVRPGAGTRVLDRNSWQMLDHDVLAWQYEAGISGKQFQDLMELRLMFEPAAAELAARRGTPEAKAQISDAVDRMRETVGVANEFAVADASFHLAILRACANSYLNGLQAVIYAGLLGSIKKTNSSLELNQASVPYHEAVARAIARGDTAGARDAMLTLLKDAGARLS
jgi:DNA-binding FadR family transcriptional regulator